MIESTPTDPHELFDAQKVTEFVHILSAMFSFSIFVLLAVVQAERPDTSCLLQLSEPKPQLLAVESGQARSQKRAKQNSE